MAVLLLLVTLIAGGIAQSMYYTSCPTPPDPCDNYYDWKTEYITFVTYTEDNYEMDTFCQTYYSNCDGRNSFTSRFSKTYCNGTVKYTSFTAQYNVTDDSFLFATPGCLWTSKTIGKVGDTSIYLRQITGGDCMLCDGSPTIVYPVLGGSPCPKPLTSCELEQIKQVIRSYGLGCIDIKALPMRLPPNCVDSQTCTSTGSECPYPCYNSDYPSYDTTVITDYGYTSPSSYNTPCGCGNTPCSCDNTPSDCDDTPCGCGNTPCSCAYSS